MAQLDIVNLMQRYGSHAVVQDVSCRVQSGQIACKEICIGNITNCFLRLEPIGLQDAGSITAAKFRRSGKED